MNNNRELQRHDIVGKKIKAIYESKPYDVGGGIWMTNPYVELEDDIAFKLEFVDIDILPPCNIRSVAMKDEALGPLKVSDKDFPIIGEKVLEVVVCNYWYSFGLYLESKRFLHYDFSPFMPNSSGYVICLDQPTTLGKGDITTYWGHKALEVQ